ncbi:MAG: UDP-N-acetylglucosamine 4,6-dehydratase (inverting) [Vicinamibacterales bacterium]
MNWNDSTILITGGTGSFGRKFTEILLRDYRPKKLIIFSRDELKQHEMRQTWDDRSGSNVRYFLGDIRDRDRLYRAMRGVDVVVHAAALKQVPACEYNPFEAVQTNVHGAQNIINAAIDTGVRRIIALSTDKAVNPVNLYGGTKLVAERLFTDGNSYAADSGTRFSCVRYGNVVGSRGSVIPLFLQQRASGRVTVTDERMTRFWLTLEQGVRFVIRSAEEMLGGEIFVPKIPSMRITDLVEAIAPRCKVEITGIRPGEKLHEALLSEHESQRTLELDGMYVVQPEFGWWSAGHWTKGARLPDGFTYTSDANTEWLTPAQLTAMCGEVVPA